MNANEVIAALAGDGVHANDHVNMGQSSNDVFPSAVHLAALDQATNQLLPALKQLERSLRAQGRSSSRTSSSPGRTHLMDAVPGDARPGVRAATRRRSASARSASRPRSSTSRQIPLGGTATGTGLNTHPKFAEQACARELTKQTKLKIDPPADPFEAQANRDALVELSGALKVVAVSLTKIAQRPRAHGLGPARRHRRDLPARAAEGLVDHARQGQPGHPRGRPPGRRAGHRQRHRDHRRRHAGPVRAQRAHPADRAQPAAVDPPARRPRRPRFAEKCVDGIEVNKDGHQALGRVDARRGHRAQRAHRLRQGRGDRQEGVGVRAPAARRRARGGRRRRALRPRSSTCARSRRGIRPRLAARASAWRLRRCAAL